ncbi:hypothetical protein FOXG_21513 [Fusarium oxysporum f. sp. lycopersici 4287]|uniref:DUF3295 domain-containing protein n=1 Tax=Fusarium oxysporum f. sp. lycopersici (strain 4287 / CBS 123668 / FGSC 9935 / NRRL 34936) TaxID=426428 RepID=A0A0J9VY10_FUSO4|nr:hypothetical protein FOXG_21513 [Fusarium oxysporum f. sp. lycopersici 4287]KNB15859.1 hypothetical protein FOXG_21513 [Fusarium oxysporum f. sp. lycopersici 4287]
MLTVNKTRLSDRKPIIKKPALRAGDSFLSTYKKQASFSNNVITRTIDDQSAVDSDTGDYIDESAIDDDDDSSEWEASMEKSGKSSMDDMFLPAGWIPSPTLTPCKLGK